MRVLAMIAAPAALLLAAGCQPKSDKVDEGKGVPETDMKAVAAQPMSGVAQVVDDKGNPVLKADGTPQKVGEKPGKQYQGTVPDRFRGAWAISPGDCTKGAGETRIRVGERSVVFYESTANIMSVTDDNMETATLDTEMSGEGMNSPQTQKMTLSPDGRTLIYERGKDIFRYGKCAS